jgi:hypothetical protein
VPAILLVSSPFTPAIAQKQSTDDLRIINKTRSLEVVRMERDRTLLYLTFRNHYEQNVIGVVVSPQKVSKMMVCFAIMYGTFTPGSTQTQRFLIFPEEKMRDIIVLAALLEDCTIGGDQETINYFEAQRRGGKAQSEKLLALITKFLKGPKIDRTTLDKIERDVLNLAQETARRATQEEGYASRISETTFVLYKIRQLENAPKRANIDIKGELIQLANILEAKKCDY